MARKSSIFFLCEREISHADAFVGTIIQVMYKKLQSDEFIHKQPASHKICGFCAVSVFCLSCVLTVL